MKVLIVSDTHRQHRNLETVLKREAPIDMLIHMGDTEGGEDYIEAIAECPCHIIAGNNDFFSSLDREKEFMIGKYRVFIAHGHNYYVALDTRRIKEEAKSRGADIVMFGHTHQPVIEKDDEIIAINPGSISYPRQYGRKASYIIMDINDSGEADFKIEFV